MKISTHYFLNPRLRKWTFLVLSAILSSFSLLNAQTCTDWGGGTRSDVSLSSGAATRHYYPQSIPSGQSGIDRSTAGYFTVNSALATTVSTHTVTVHPTLGDGTTGKVVLSFMALSMNAPNAQLIIYDGPTASGSSITINQANSATYAGTTLTFNGPVTMQFSSSTAGGSGNFDINIRFMTGDQVFQSCRGRNVAVWTAFVKPDSYIFVDDIDPFQGNSAPICVGHFDNNRQFISSELSLCIDYHREVSSVMWGYYPGQISYTRDALPNHDIDRQNGFNADDQLKSARLIWILANAPLTTKQQQLDAQLAVWWTLEESVTYVHPSGSLERQAQLAVPSLPTPPEPTFSATAGTGAAPGSAVNFDVDFNISNGYPAELKLVIPAGVTVQGITGNATLTGDVLTFSSLPGHATVALVSATAQQAKLTAIYNQANFWNVTNLEVYQSCDSQVQDFIGLSRKDITYPFREATGVWDAALPVTLVNFTLSTPNNLVALNWTTSHERNNRGFEVQRSQDAEIWSTLHFVESKASGGNSDGLLTYKFFDTGSLKGASYYRLKQLDYDGKFSYSPVRSAYLENPGVAFSVAPNPVVANLIIGGLLGEEEIQLFDAAGRTVGTVRNAAGATQKSFDMSGFPQGIYLIKVRSENGLESTKRILKM